MIKAKFLELCGIYGVDSHLALECDEIVSALRTAKTYPEFMREDALALIEDAFAGSF